MTSSSDPILNSVCDFFHICDEADKTGDEAAIRALLPRIERFHAWGTPDQRQAKIDEALKMLKSV